MIMLRLCETKVAKGKYDGAKKPIKIYVNIDNIVVSKLVETKIIGYLDKIIQPLALILPKMSEYVRTFKVQDGDKTIWTKTEDLQNVELNTYESMMIDT